MLFQVYVKERTISGDNENVIIRQKKRERGNQLYYAKASTCSPKGKTKETQQNASHDLCPKEKEPLPNSNDVS